MQFKSVDFHARNHLAELLEYAVKDYTPEIKEEIKNWIDNSPEAQEASATHIKEIISELKDIESLSQKQIKGIYEKLCSIKMTPSQNQTEQQKNKSPKQSNLKF